MASLPKSLDASYLLQVFYTQFHHHSYWTLFVQSAVTRHSLHLTTRRRVASLQVFRSIRFAAGVLYSIPPFPLDTFHTCGLLGTWCTLHQREGWHLCKSLDALDSLQMLLYSTPLSLDIFLTYACYWVLVHITYMIHVTRYIFSDVTCMLTQQHAVLVGKTYVTGNGIDSEYQFKEIRHKISNCSN